MGPIRNKVLQEGQYSILYFNLQTLPANSHKVSNCVEASKKLEEEKSIKDWLSTEACQSIKPLCWVGWGRGWGFQGCRQELQCQNRLQTLLSGYSWTGWMRQEPERSRKDRHFKNLNISSWFQMHIRPTLFVYLLKLLHPLCLFTSFFSCTPEIQIHSLRLHCEVFLSQTKLPSACPSSPYIPLPTFPANPLWKRIIWNYRIWKTVYQQKKFSRTQ